jgi:hypothetical protein
MDDGMTQVVVVVVMREIVRNMFIESKKKTPQDTQIHVGKEIHNSSYCTARDHPQCQCQCRRHPA